MTDAQQFWHGTDPFLLPDIMNKRKEDLGAGLANMPDFRRTKSGEDLEGAFASDDFGCAADYPTGSWNEKGNTQFGVKIGKDMKRPVLIVLGVLGRKHEGIWRNQKKASPRTGNGHSSRRIL